MDVILNWKSVAHVHRISNTWHSSHVVVEPFVDFEFLNVEFSNTLNHSFTLDNILADHSIIYLQFATSLTLYQVVFMSTIGFPVLSISTPFADEETFLFSFI